MDASAALERLRDISSQVRVAVVFDSSGAVLGSTLGDDERSQQLATEARALSDAAEARGAEGQFAQLEVALQGGSVFVVRDGERLVAATTPPEPTVGLVFYDLKSCLRELDASAKPKQPAKPKPVSRPKTKPKAKAAEQPKPKPAPRRKRDDAKP
jgi:predicted regulator of Ras-like GTPase activity (Roadblock/LC7/MglB family)